MKRYKFTFKNKRFDYENIFFSWARGREKVTKFKRPVLKETVA
jgi:hypothetical protein